MDSDSNNATRGLVRAILALTAEQRQSSNVQSICQYIYCKFSINDQDDNTNETCYVTTTKLSLFDDIKKKDDSYVSSVADYIALYIYPIFIFIGILGNSLSCFIMFRNVRRNGYSANLYLTLLAFVDCLYLLGSALPHWISIIDSTLNIKLLSDLCCRLVYWFGHFTTHLSAGLVVTVTVERFIAIQYPLLAPKINTASHTHIVLIILVTFFFLLDSRVLILVKHIKESIHIVRTCPNSTDTKYERPDVFRCDITDGKSEQLWVFIDFAVYTLIPFLIIVTLNSLIIHRLIHAQRLRQSMSCSNGKSSKHECENLRRNVSDEHQTKTNKYKYFRRCESVPTRKSAAKFYHSEASERSLRLTMKSSELSTESSLELKHRSDHQHESSLIRQTTTTHNRRLTILLLYVSFSFLALTLPAVVFNLIVSVTLKSRSLAFENYSSLTSHNLTSNTILSYTIMRLLMIINHSINFILYFVVGKRFRRDLKKLCFCY